MVRKIKFRSLAICIAVFFSVVACGDNKTGTYSSGTGVILNLESGGKASFEMMGDKTLLKYVVDGNELKLTDSKGDTVTWRIVGNSTIVGPMGVELKKLK